MGPAGGGEHGAGVVGEITPTWYELALLILGAVLITAAVGWMAVALFVASWKRSPRKE